MTNREKDAGRQRFWHQIALDFITAAFFQKLSLLLGFDPFCNDTQNQALTEANYRLNDFLIATRTLSSLKLSTS